MNLLARKIVSDNIKALRQQAGYKREELSLMIGCDNSYISKLEKYRINISIDKLKELAEIFGVELRDLFKINN